MGGVCVRVRVCHMKDCNADFIIKTVCTLLIFTMMNWSLDGNKEYTRKFTQKRSRGQITAIEAI